MTDLPPVLAAKIADINRDIDACGAERADLNARMFELEQRREDYLEAAEICRQAWCPPFSEEQMRATALATDVANAKEFVGVVYSHLGTAREPR